jgi:hypothetical protein
VQAEQGTGQNQMAGAGDGQEFGQALDHTHHSRLGQQNKIQNDVPLSYS